MFRIPISMLFFKLRLLIKIDQLGLRFSSNNKNIFVNFSMNYQSCFLTKNELNKLLDGIFFSKEEIDQRKKVALKTGFNSWDDFLNFGMLFYESSFDIDKAVNELSTMYHDGQIRGSLLLAISNNVNTNFEKENYSIFERFEKLPDDLKKSAGQFDSKLAALYLKMVICKIHSLEPDAAAFAQGAARDLFQEMESLDPNFREESKLLIATVDNFSLNNSNEALAKSKKDTYFQPNAHLLLQLQDAWVKEGLTYFRSDFANLFDHKNLKKGVPPILWKGEIYELGFQLWVLNGKKDFTKDGTTIGHIIDRFFIFKTSKKTNSILNSYTRSLEKFRDEAYVNRMQKKSVRILASLGLLESV